MLLLLLLTMLDLALSLSLLHDAGGQSWSWPDFALIMSAECEYFIFLFVPLAVWHLGDAIQVCAATSRWTRVFDRFRVVATMLVLTGLATVFIRSRWLDDLGCPEVVLSEGWYQFDGCGSWTPGWKVAILVACEALLLLAAAGKMVLALSSRLTGWMSRESAT